MPAMDQIAVATRHADKSPQNSNPCRALIAAYREGLGLAAVAVMGATAAIRIIAVERGEPSALPAGEEIATLWWCRSLRHAQSLAAAARRSRRRIGEESSDVARACAAIVRAASRLGIVLQSDEQISAEALQVVARLDDEILQQKQAGVLRSVNKAYREYRLDATARGEPTLRYAQWMDRYKEQLIRQIAETLR